MADAPWMSIIGLGEDGPDGLSGASRRALEQAELILGSPRHLALLGPVSQETIEWPVPFADGLALLTGARGRKTVVLASGDPFWFGAGSVIARHFEPEEWRAFSAPSTFSLVANRLAWRLETTLCLGLHAKPLSRLRPFAAPGCRMIVLLRDGKSVHDLAAYLTDLGLGESCLSVFEAVGGPNEKRTDFAALVPSEHVFKHPVCAAIEIAGKGPVLPAVSGICDDFFETDGAMTKRHVRAATLSALAPRAGELLWDIGSGSGTIAIEWLLSDARCDAVSIEPRSERTALIRLNAERLGADRLSIVTGIAPDALSDLPRPDAVFIGGGLSAAMIADLENRIAAGTRVVANAVTLEAETLLADVFSRKGGEMHRLEISRAKPLGSKHAWEHAYPVVQWSGTL